MQEPKVIYEHWGFVVIDKPVGLLVHPVGKMKSQESRINESTLVDWLLQHYPEVRTVGDSPRERPGIVHRLDRDTSGAMLVARTQEHFEYLKGLFTTRTIKKEYLALVFSEVKSRRGVIDTPIGIKQGTVRRTTHSEKMSKEAVTDYSLLRVLQAEGEHGELKYFSLLRVSPRTGRTHQIRVHLASIHHPVAGDVLYGRKKQPPWATHLMLHALSLEFKTKEGERFKIETEVPREFAGFV